MAEEITRANAVLLEALAAHSGLVCLVGAGGKKTTLYRLAMAHSGRVGITSTVAIPPFPRTLTAQQVIADDSVIGTAVVEAAARARVVAFAKPSSKSGRLRGLDPSQVTAIFRAAKFDIILVKADGARSRWIKAPEGDEPQLPKEASTVIQVVSARVMGEPLSDRIAHRVERLARVLKIQPGDILTAEHIAHLLASEAGMLKGVGRARVVPLINMVDNEALKDRARQAAARALSLSTRFDRVVLAAMSHPIPWIEVVGR